MRLALIDTSAIYALTVQGDAHHTAALKFAREWLNRQNAFILPEWVFVETMTLLKARFGSAVALRVGQDLRHQPAYRWLPLGREDEREMWAIFQKYADKAWSYTDCALLALAQRLSVRDVFAFDVHVAQMPNLTRRPK
jgi:predicted nucleic acid-binding protein